MQLPRANHCRKAVGIESVGPETGRSSAGAIRRGTPLAATLLLEESTATRALVTAVLLLMPAGCDLPRDPEQTLERIRAGTLRVGITARPPWTTFNVERPGGIEASLVQQFSETLAANIEWTEGSEAELMERLHQGQLDLVIGGLDDASPWDIHSGFTRPYITFADKRHVMAVRQGENRFLLELDKFLQSRRAEIRRLVEAKAAE